jgi:hypothetical protein
MRALTSMSNEFYALLAALAFAGMAVPTVWGYVSRASKVRELAGKLRKGRVKRGVQTQAAVARSAPRKVAGSDGFGRR